MNNSQILPWHETPSSPRSVFQDGVALSFLSRWTSCVEGTILSRGGPLGFCMGGINTYTSASHPPSLSIPLKRSLHFSLSCMGPSGSTAQPSHSTAEETQAAVPLHNGSTALVSTAVVPLGCLAPPPCPQPHWRDSLSLSRPSGSTALPAVVRPKGHKRQYRSTAVVPPVTPLS